MALTSTAKFGDILEIETPKGLAYVQYTHEDPGGMGSLIRVLPGLHQGRPANFATVASQKEAYCTFYTMRHALRKRLAQIVSHQPIPDWAIPSPIMRAANGRDSNGRASCWRTLRGDTKFTPENLSRIPNAWDLTAAQSQLSIHSLWAHDHLVKQLVEGWTPERDEELRLNSQREHERSPGSPRAESSEMLQLRYFLYFSREKDAKLAGRSLRQMGFSIEINRATDENNWLMLATAPPDSEDKIDETRIELEELAARYDGEYDGWELGPKRAGTVN